MPERLIVPAVLEQAPIGIAVWDLELRYLAVNAHLAEINGLPAEAHLGRRVPDVLPGLAVQEEILRGVLASGRPSVGRRVLGVLPGYDEPRWRHASYFPVRGASGDVLAIAAVVVDVTDQVRLETATAEARAESERERLILQEVVAQVPVGIVVTWGDEQRFVAANGRGLALLGADGELVGRTLDDVDPKVGAPLEETFETGETIHRTELRVPPRAYDVTYMPIVVGGASAGVVAVSVDVTERVLQRDALVRELAEEHQVTEILQRALLPSALPAPPGLSLAARYEPARHRYMVGGDFYDAVEWTDGRLALVLGDVSGKGPRAAGVSATVRAALRTALLYEDSPAGLARALNAVLVRELEPDQFVTLALAAVVPRGTGEFGLELVLAGHPAPQLRRSGGAVEAVGETGPALGLAVGMEWPTATGTLRPADALLLYSDGLVEARRPRTVAPDELAAVIAAAPDGTPAALIDAVYAALVDGEEGGPDDVALLTVRAEPTPATP